MNKLFSKIAALSVGLAMAVGVGVAVGSQKGAVRAKAASVTITPSDFEAVTSTDTTQTVGDLTFTLLASTITADQVRVFKGKSLTISVADGNITSIQMTCTVSGAEKYGPGCFEAQTGYSYDGYKGTWTGEASSVTFTASSNQVRITEFVIEYGASVDPDLDNMTIKESGNELDGGTLQWSSTEGIYHLSAEDSGSPVSGVTWSTNNSSVATIGASTGYLTTVAPGQVTIYAEASGYNKASATVTISKGWKVESITVSGSMSKTDYTTAESWSHAGLTATAEWNTGYEEDVSSEAVWTFNPAEPAEDVKSVVATATYEEESGSSSAQAVTVTVAHAGTAEDPFTVAEGIAKCQEIGTTASGDWYVKGIISAITSTEADATGQYHNATFNLSDDGHNSNFLIAYRVKYIDGADFDADKFAELQVGLVAVVHGSLVNYKSNTPEFSQGGALVSLEEQSTGDVDVSFTPASTSIEIGATGTYTASSETSGAVFTWSVDDSSVLTVNTNTGAFEAVGLGVARVTVTATAGGKQGSTYADITVNGSGVLSIAEVNVLASGLPSSGSENTSPYYVYVGGYVKEFATSSKDGNPRAFDIFSLDEESSIMIYTNTGPYADFIDGLALGDYIVVKGKIQNYNGKYELINPEKVSSAKSCLSFVFEFKSYTEGEEGICTNYDGVTSNKAAFEAIWETLEASYNALGDEEKALLVSMTGCGDTLVNAMGLYDYVTGKYELENFVEGRQPVVFAYINNLTDSVAENNSMIIIIAIAAVSAIAFGALLVFKKKKHN